MSDSHIIYERRTQVYFLNQKVDNSVLINETA